MPIVPLFGKGFKGKSSNVTAQRRINLYGETPHDADKSQFVLYPRPGMTQIFTNNASGFGGGPFRGLIRVENVVTASTGIQSTKEYLFGAQAQFGVFSAGNPNGFLTAALAGTPVFRTSQGPIVYADNGFSILGVDGVSAYVASYSVGAFGQTDIQSLGVANFPYGATSICFLAGRFVAPDPSTPGRFRWSALNDYSTWNALDYATAETIPDALTGVFTYNGQLVLFGSRSIEWWAPTGDTSIFGRVQATAQAWGLFGYSTLRYVDDMLMFCAQREGFEVEVVAMQGYQVQPVSTPDVEYDINQEVAKGANSFSACVIRSGGHTFYVLNLSTKTWVYDASTGEWDEWQTDGGRYAGQYSTTCYGRLTVTDYRDSRIYAVSARTYTDDASAIVRQLETRHIFHDLNRLTVRNLVLDMETGPDSVAAVYPTCVSAPSSCRQTTPSTCGDTGANYTVEGWLMTHDLGASLGPFGVLSRTISAGSVTWRLEITTASQLQWQLNGVNTVGFQLATADLDTPFHFAFVYDSVAQTLTAYKNGVQQAQATSVTDGGGTSTTAAVYLGSRVGLFNLNGTIGGVRIWGSVLSAATIQANMQTKLQNTVAGNLISQWWDFPVGQIGNFINTGTTGGATIAGNGIGANHSGYQETPQRGAQVMLQVSRDGGHTFGNEIWTTMGLLGRYATRVFWWRLGRGRDFVFRFRIADAIKAVFIGAAIQVDE